MTTDSVDLVEFHSTTTNSIWESTIALYHLALYRCCTFDCLISAREDLSFLNVDQTQASDLCRQVNCLLLSFY